MAQVVSEYEALSSNSSTAKKKKKNAVLINRGQEYTTWG
jgi:hypothetical protein